MDICRKAWSIARINFQRWKGDQRVWIIFLTVGVLVVDSVKGFTVYGMESGKECTAYLLPFLFARSTISIASLKILLYMAMVLLLCDAPFIYETTPYMVTRSRRNGWWMGECLYIFLTSFLYVTFLVVITTAVVFPVITFGEEWGGVVDAFSYGDENRNPLEMLSFYDMGVTLSEKVIGFLYPFGAQLYTFFTVWASMFLLGLVQYLISLLSRSMFLGAVGAGLLVFMDPFLYYLSESGGNFGWLVQVSPVSWVSLEFLNVVNRNEILTVPYVLVMFAVLIFLLLLAIWRTSKKVMIEVRGEI